MPNRIIVFAPHPDDETLGCGGTIAKKVRDGDLVYIVFVTDGRNSHKIVLGIEENPNPEEVKAIRREEGRTVARLLGVQEENLTFMDYMDGHLDQQIALAAERVRRTVVSIEPDTIFVPHELDLNKDHRATNVIVRSALKEWSPRLELYMYVIWYGDKSEYARVMNADNAVEIDISEFLELKRKAIATYRSQVALEFSSQTRPVLPAAFLSRFLLPTERFVRRWNQ